MATPKELPKFNLDEIPESSRQALLAIIHRAANEYIKQPGVAEKFEKWKAEREQRRLASKACGQDAS